MLNLTLGDDWQSFIEGKVKAGHFATAEEVVREGLRALKEHDDFLALHRGSIRGKIQGGWDSLRSGRSMDGESALEELQKGLVESELADS